MEKIKVHVGTQCITSSGRVSDHMRPVEFEGEKIAKRTEHYGGGDSRGVTETLFKTPVGRYVVYVENWTKWQGETSTSKLVEASDEDLDVGGRFEMLAREAGMGRPMTLDEALVEEEPPF